MSLLSIHSTALHQEARGNAAALRKLKINDKKV